ncbi:hypothetical protein GCM10020331_044750 [Ectobacillus funiculus]
MQRKFRRHKQQEDGTTNEVIRWSINTPLAYDWSTDEIVDAIRFYEAVEQAYEKKELSV